MATPEQIEEWKRLYDGVFSVSLRNVDYIFRAVTFSEYNALMRSEDESSAETEEDIVSAVLLEPRTIDAKVPAGAITAIAEEVLNVSGYGDPKRAKRVLEQKRQEVSQVQGLMKAFVLATMPAYKEEELDDLNYSQLAAKVALAEQIIEVRQAMFPMASGESRVRLDLIDPEEEDDKAQQEAQKRAAQKKGGQAGLNDPIAQKLHQALGG